ncbi:NAD(P)-dependent alcohol dehydrogenase [Maribellus mangrovi]|uniref:NAD(P)-dependent alcohol dehydrogenase n=1 Tax=Maribellus mangrovi TaxID=3133146 RepID=UPI0030EC3AED
MKAIECTRYGGPEVLRLTQVEKPLPKDNEVLIKMRATAVTASDCIVRGFKLPRRSPRGILMGLVLGFKKPRNPVLGMIVSGTVEEVGKQVTRFQTGDAVYGWTVKDDFTIRFGTYAEYKCLTENSTIVKKPEMLGFEGAAAIPYGALMALLYLRKGKIQQRKKVLVYGASGAIGTAAVQLSKYFGTEVTGVCSTNNLELVKSLGADAVLDYTKDDPSTAGNDFDFMLDAVGTWKDSDFKQQCRKASTVNGTYVSVDEGSPNATIADLELLNKMVEEGKLRPVIDRTYKLEEMVEAHRYVDAGHKKGNVIIAIA